MVWSFVPIFRRHHQLCERRRPLSDSAKLYDWSGCRQDIPSERRRTLHSEHRLTISSRQVSAGGISAADLAKKPNYRQVVVAVENRGDVPPPALSQTDLHLYQGGKALTISFFEAQPATVAILVDTSGSMDRKLPKVRQALAVFINRLDAKDQILLGAFSDRLFVLQNLTTDHQAAIDSLKMLHAYGRTALYNVIAEGLHRVSQGCYVRKALLVVTDGMDDASNLSLEETEDQARKAKLPIYFLGIGNPNNSSTVIGPITIGPMSGDMDTLDKKPVLALATASGGQVFTASLNDESESFKATTAIAREIGNHYTVGFISDGSISQLKFAMPNSNDLSVKIDSAS
jgi:VWFA-related protein